MKVSVKVPATTANLGSGFDCLGMALPIYNIVTIEETVLPGSGIEINMMSENNTDDEFAIEHIPTDENNIVFKAVEMLYNLIGDGETPPDLGAMMQGMMGLMGSMGGSEGMGGMGGMAAMMAGLGGEMGSGDKK